MLVGLACDSQHCVSVYECVITVHNAVACKPNMALYTWWRALAPVDMLICAIACVAFVFCPFSWLCHLQQLRKAWLCAMLDRMYNSSFWVS